MMVHTGYPYVLVSKSGLIFWAGDQYVAQNFSALFMAHRTFMYNYICNRTYLYIHAEYTSIIIGYL